MASEISPSTQPKHRSPKSSNLPQTPPKPKPKALNPEPYTLDPKPLNPQPSKTFKPYPSPSTQFEMLRDEGEEEEKALQAVFEVSEPSVCRILMPYLEDHGTY